jgi:hypothetical protein
VLRALGIETHLQLAITLCVIALVVVTTLGGSGGATWVFFTYRSLLVAIAILAAIGSRHADLRICRVFLATTGVLFGLMLVSLLRIPGSHFEAYYLWSKYAFFAIAFINLANYSRYQSARWRGVLAGAIVIVNLAHLLPDLIRNRAQAIGFSANNPNYFATFLLIGLAVSIAAAAFAVELRWRAAAAMCGTVLLFGVVKTSSRGATLAAIAMIVVAAFRARGRIPRQIWLVAGLGCLLMIVIASPYLVHKFVDRGESDPYNYARTTIWSTSLQAPAARRWLRSVLSRIEAIHIADRRSRRPLLETRADGAQRISAAHRRIRVSGGRSIVLDTRLFALSHLETREDGVARVLLVSRSGTLDCCRSRNARARR